MNFIPSTWNELYVKLSAVVVVLILVCTAHDVHRVHWPIVLLASIAVACFDVSSIKLPSGQDLSIVASLLFVVGVTNGVFAVVMVTAILGVFLAMYHRKLMDAVLFNVCQYAISATTATLVFQALGGHVGQRMHFAHIWPYLGFDVTYFCVNVILVGIYLHLEQKIPLGKLLNHLLEPHSVLIYFVVIFFGVLMTIIYQSEGWIGLFACSVLLGVLGYTFHRYYALYDHFRSLSNHDELTGLKNHRYFQEKLSELLQNDVPVSLALVDIDYFKKYNDRYGHLQGDELLREIAHLLRDMVPNNGWICRYGGEEFAILLPHTGVDGALVIAENVRQELSRTRFYGSDQMPMKCITVSVGVSNYPSMAHSKETLIQTADEALYKVKFTSRNRVQVYSSDVDEMLNHHDLVPKDIEIVH